ncbi:PAS domain-containing protein [Chloroflexales bacterium ZM16-3]|nr:PAS domain-containing protein [Chloroflexales bacterium ZM16-3]
MRPPELPALQEWRRTLLNFFLRISLAFALPIVVVSTIQDLRGGRIFFAFFACSGYIIIVAVALLPQVSVQIRAQVLIAFGYLVGTLLIIQNGIADIGILLLFLTTIMAALLCHWQQALGVAALVTATVIAVFFAIGAGWLAFTPNMAASLADPTLLAVNVMFTIYTIWLVLAMVASLINRLSESLLLTEAANADLERRVVERTASLNEAHRHLQLILRTIPEQFWLKDRQGRYMMASDVLATYHGYRPEDMIGRTADQLYDADLAAFIAKGDQKVFDGQPYYNERAVGGKDGTMRWFDSSRTPIYDEAGALIGLVGLSRDITVRKEAELALARQLRYAEALASCSRILLTRSADDDAYRKTLANALEVLRVAVGADRVAVYSYPDWEQGLARISTMMRLIGAVNAPTLRPQRMATLAEVRDIPDELSWCLAQGKSFSGVIAKRFPNNPIFEQYQADNGIRTVVFQPIVVGDLWWGHISVNNHTDDRIWDDDAVQMLHTAAEMIVSFNQGWEAEQALAASEASLRALRDALPDLLFVMDNEAVIVNYHAPNIENLYLPPESFLGRKVDAVLPDPIGPQLIRAIRETRSVSKMQIIEYALPLAGELRIYEARLLPISPAQILCVVRDITEARQSADAVLRAKEAAEAADRAKSSFLATMSHEIRTPLNAVLGMASLLAETSLGQEQRAYVETIRTGGETLLAVISHILDFSQIDSGRVELESQPFDLVACVDDACALVSYQAKRKGLAFAKDIRASLPHTVIGDVVRLRQVLINLLANAVKFTAQGTVTLRVRPIANSDATATQLAISNLQSAIVFEVRDTGIGIAQEQIAQIFEPFVQADSATTRRYGGTGLGLAICRQLVELMGGMISAISTPHRGSTFTVVVPLQPVDAPVTPTSIDTPREAVAPRPLRVLVAEDNPINQLVIMRFLDRLGYQADMVKDGILAVDAIRQRPYDVVLMDVEMPEIDGIQATQQIRQLGATVHQPYIIALTAHDVMDEHDKYLRAGMDTYLSKPMQIEDLRQALLGMPAAPG